jgi:hypothetical protein
MQLSGSNARRRRWVLLVTLGLFLGAAAWRITSPLRQQVYLARTLFTMRSSPAAFGGQPRSQLALVKSRPVLAKALKNSKVAALASVMKEVDPVAWLETKVQADFLAPEVLRITITGEAPDDLLVLANAVGDAYLRTDRSSFTFFRQLIV